MDTQKHPRHYDGGDVRSDGSFGCYKEITENCGFEYVVEIFNHGVRWDRRDISIRAYQQSRSYLYVCVCACVCVCV